MGDSLENEDFYRFMSNYRAGNTVCFGVNPPLGPSALDLGQDGSIFGLLPVQGFYQSTYRPGNASLTGPTSSTPGATRTFTMGAVSERTAGGSYEYTHGGVLTLAGKSIGTTTMTLGPGVLWQLPAPASQSQVLIVGDASDLKPSGGIGGVATLGCFLVEMNGEPGGLGLGFGCLVLNR